MQKAIRRADTEAAAYWTWQLEAAGLGPWAWRRLKIITSEDVGHAWPEGPAVINALHGTWRELLKAKRRGDGLLVLLHAAILLAEAPKSRLACWMAVAFDGGAVPKREIPRGCPTPPVASRTPGAAPPRRLRAGPGSGGVVRADARGGTLLLTDTTVCGVHPPLSKPFAPSATQSSCSPCARQDR